MTYLRRVRFVLFTFAFVVLPYIRFALSAEESIPAISIPPEAQYLAQSIGAKYASFCKKEVACLPPLAFATSANRARMLTFVRRELGGPLTVTEYEGPAEMRGGANVIIRTSRHSVTVSGTGTLTAYAAAVSNDDFEKDERRVEMGWGEVVDLLDAVDQFLTSLADHEKRVTRTPDKGA